MSVMQEGCLFELMELPEKVLRQVLPKASVKTLARLISAYPHSAGKVFDDVLNRRMSPTALQYIREEIRQCPTPSYAQLREAERELHRIIRSEGLPQDPYPPRD